MVTTKLFRREKRGFKTFNELALKFVNYTSPSDPYFKYQWYLKNDGSSGKAGLDLNVQEAWALGFTGKNVTVAILDDGVDYTHPDLRKNYNSEASYDYSSDDPYPYPRYTDDWFNSHGTRCAGEVVSAKDNRICGVGVAYDAQVAGIRMLDQPLMTDWIEAASISHKSHLIDIYSASWGPTDDGTVLDGPREHTQRAILRGIEEGREGKGSIFVWASGDGGGDDDCNCDGYTNSMWTISINSAISNGETAIFDESCSSTLASTFSNGRRKSRTHRRSIGVATTDLYAKCTLYHSGTSASAPQAAGVFALVLQANPELTWRDVQHLTVLTAKRNQLYDPQKKHLWQLNGAGLEYNHLFGFGVLDAGDMVKLALEWTPLPDRRFCRAGLILQPTLLRPGESLVLEINSTVCVGTEYEVSYLEHVQSILSVRGGRRGSLTIHLTSPLGTRSLLLQPRPKDNSNAGFRRWPFMTTHMWAERAKGLWKLEIDYLRGVHDHSQAAALFTEWQLVLHGTKQPLFLNQKPLSEKTKLAVVKRVHEHDFVAIKRFTHALKTDQQKRVGDNPKSKI